MCQYFSQINENIDEGVEVMVGLARPFGILSCLPSFALILLNKIPTHYQGFSPQTPSLGSFIVHV